MAGQGATLPVVGAFLTVAQTTAICNIEHEVTAALSLIYSAQEFGTVTVTIKPGEYQVVVINSTKGPRPIMRTP